MLAARLGADAAFAGACADQVALDVGKPAKYGDHQSPRAGRCVRPRLREAEELCTRVDDFFDETRKARTGSRGLRDGAEDAIFKCRHTGPGGAMDGSHGWSAAEPVG